MPILNVAQTGASLLAAQKTADETQGDVAGSTETPGGRKARASTSPASQRQSSSDSAGPKVVVRDGHATHGRVMAELPESDSIAEDGPG